MSKKALFDKSYPCKECGAVYKNYAGLALHAGSCKKGVQTLEGEWLNLQTLMDFINENLMTVNPKFVVNNFDFKYIDIRIDMRTGHAILSRGTNKTDLITKLEEKEREAVALEDALKKANLCCCDNEEKNRELKAENERLIREVEILRQYGNKDCTAMADEALASYR